MDNYQELEKLKELQDKGILSDSEFQLEKKKILSEMHNGSKQLNNNETDIIKKSSNNMMECPYCAENIGKNSKACKYCGESMTEEKQQEEDLVEFICPYCAEKIDKDSKKCKYCGENFEDNINNPSITVENKSLMTLSQKKIYNKNSLNIGGIGLFLVFMGAILSETNEELGVIILGVGTIMFYMGIYYYLKYKGYSGWYTLLILLGIIGLIIMILLRDKNPDLKI